MALSLAKRSESRTASRTVRPSPTDEGVFVCTYMMGTAYLVVGWLKRGPEKATVEDVQTVLEDARDDQYGGVFEKRKNRH